MFTPKNSDKSLPGRSGAAAIGYVFAHRYSPPCPPSGFRPSFVLPWMRLKKLSS